METARSLLSKLDLDDLKMISANDIINSTSKSPSTKESIQKQPKFLTEEEKRKLFDWTNMIFDEISTEEALKSIKNDPEPINSSVNAISKLQEILILKKITPVYTEFGNVKGLFVIRVSCETLTGGTLSAEGTAKTKKEAKLQAAQLLLNLITKTNLNVKVKNDDEISSILVENVAQPTDKLVNLRRSPTISTINALQEFLVKRSWPQAGYKELHCTGPDHQRTFSTSCTVGHFIEIGSGNTKKISKHTAAEKMLNRLAKYPISVHSLPSL